MSASAPVGTDGHYSLESLAADSYTVSFNSSDRNFVSEYYDNAADQESATRVTVGAAATVSDINAVLDLGASITGTVTIGTSHAAAARVYVTAYTADNSWSASSQTDDEGHYALVGMRAGSYKLDFDGTTANGVSEWYDNAADIGSAKAVVVAAQATVPNIDVNLEPGGTITGAVTQNIGGVVSAAADVSVSVRSATGNFMNQTITDTDGHYALNGLAAASYTVAFNGGWGSNLLTQYYQNAATASTSTPVVVTAAATVTGIDAGSRNRSGDQRDRDQERGGSENRRRQRPYHGVQRGQFLGRRHANG
ncbi:carboxypeptidase regulatory-like domain-containing protein [Cryobacterium breve]|uniref:Carboxypeptidase regulatory-like domain-containing protein n=1 Tax=Cryobacterium breve TaxID=1259258 RepID=A0ABY7NAU5_9MICO|nr:carboxypeptidase-like regulatory domain-containing protein [Cryobacterium breve]WBM79390.1 carboxypeptidase regulatory-like domain-containing protein [Cryobacterium breve]